MLRPSRRLASFSQDLWYEALKSLAAPIVRDQLVNTEVIGLENIPAAGPALLVPNHRTMTDPFLLAAYVPRRIHYVVAGFLSRFPLSSRVIEGTGNIILPVSSGGRSQELIRKARRMLLRGRLVGVFPEGVDNFVNGSPSGTVSAFHSSFARLIVGLKVPDLPVVPIAITGDEEQALVRFPSQLMRAIDPGNKAWIEGEVRGTIYRKARIHVGSPLAFDNFYDLPDEQREAGIRQITRVVREAVVDLAEAPSPKRAATSRKTPALTGPLFDPTDI
jgi:1-acyl-sn-glycerol-3-phosphate acyltransferase